MMSLSLLFFGCFSNSSINELLNNEDHIGRDHIIMDVNAGIPVFKRKL